MTAHAERLVWLAKQNSDATLSELAFACNRSEAWTRKVLKQANISFAKPPRAAKGYARNATPCRCGHRRDLHCAGGRACGHKLIKRHFGESVDDFITRMSHPDTWVTSLGSKHCLQCGCNDFEGPQKANLSTPCARPGCGHAKNDHCWTQGARKHGQGVYAHHFSLQDGTSTGHFQCISNHCLLAPYNEGKIEPCLCPEYLDPYTKAATKARKRKNGPAIQRMLALAELLADQEQEQAEESEK
jgi:hypothetical protein